MITKITKQWLQENNACENQVQTFETEWPNGAEITLENCLRAIKLELNIMWLTEKLWSFRSLADYKKDKRIDPLLTEYNRGIALLLTEYNREKALLFYNLKEFTEVKP